MISFTTIIKKALPFLQSGVVPSHTPPELVAQYAEANHFKSRKFFIVFSSVFILGVFYFSSVGVLFLLPDMPEKVQAFVAMFSRAIEIIAIIVAFYTGAQAVVDLKYHGGSNNLTSYPSEPTRDVEHTFAEQYKDDPSYAPIEYDENDTTWR